MRAISNSSPLFQEAQQEVVQGTLDQPLPTRMGYLLGQVVPVTGRHFLTYRWDQSSAADTTFWIKRVPVPVLIMRGTNDPIILVFEPNWLMAAATSEGSLVPSIRFVSIPDAGHSLAENQDAVIDGMPSWLGEQRL